MRPLANKLSVTVGIPDVVPGDKVPTVRATGPMLGTD